VKNYFENDGGFQRRRAPVPGRSNVDMPSRFANPQAGCCSHIAAPGDGRAPQESWMVTENL
jgi:hypothetical protein